MAKTFKVGSRVAAFTTHRGELHGAGKIIEIREGARGAWYGVEETATHTVYFIRLSGLGG